MKIDITIVATESYQYALRSLARALRKAMYLVEESKHDFRFVLVGDKNLRNHVKFFEEIAPVRTIIGDWEEHENYKENAQLAIANMRQEAFDSSVGRGVDFCWSLDSDVLPPPNSLRSSLDMLAFDSGYYSVVQCPYPSQGGGPFLGGHGTPQNPIAKDFEDDERIIPEEIIRERAEIIEKSKSANLEEADVSRLQEIYKIIQDCPPIEEGNVWKLNANRWRRRGWFDRAYPGIGQGAVVPIEWCGFGCTLMNKEALSMADFSGYDGRGTEDLFIIWRRWFANGVRIANLAHCPCSHIIRVKDGKGQIELKNCFAFHEPRSIAEYEGHLRQEIREFHNFDASVTVDDTTK